MAGALRTIVLAALAAACVAGLDGCSQTGTRARFYRESSELAAARDGSDFLKCHTRDGRVYVLARWSIAAGVVSGEGRHYDVDRRFVSDGPQSVPLAEVAIFETNRPETVPRETTGYIVLGVVTVASLGMTVFCAANPKSCFGSCPTFYVHDGTDWRLEAEGFSASVARPLEATDVDAMWTARPTRTTTGASVLDVQMANEALETHLVDHVRVLAAARPPGGRVYRTGNRYWRSSASTAPSRCRAGGTDCLDEVRAIDDRAYLSAADPHDLVTKETVELTFPRPAGDRPLGLVLAARNSLLNTFVFYQGLSYAGRTAGDLVARLETQAPEDTAILAGELRSLVEVFGPIAVELQDARGGWHDAGRYDEIGPIAREVQLVPLPALDGGAGVHVRLTMTKGNWKLDHAGLVVLDAPVHPAVLEPTRVLRDGRSDDAALAALRPGGGRLATYPGDLYTLRFEPPPGDVELFLESRGYYYEWMRDAWLTEESPIDVARMLEDPHAAMRALAPRYKRIEDRMESIFWKSRVGVHR